ncbi:MAG: hypothetical protein IPJ84_07525 [Bdellovibrionales bacterium]|nr:hypothetical protein [Bdellovibrionales bacterium]
MFRSSKKNTKAEKVGFITIDRFSLTSEPDKEFQQIEVELFPQHLSTYKQESVKFDEFWSYLKESLPASAGGREIKTPKYLYQSE